MFDLFGRRKKKEEEVKQLAKDCLLFILNEELEKIKKWNEETFPDATLGGQFEKLEEEFEEYFATNDKFQERKELADIFIVLGGLRRWESRVGMAEFRMLTETMPLHVIGDLLVDISEKMEINRNRVWKKTGNGKFHHEEKKK